MLKNKTLAKIAVFGGFALCSSGYYMQTRITDQVRAYDYYVEALNVLRKNPAAIALLGEPIKDRTFKLSDPESNFSDGYTARFQVPVSGPKARGNYYFWSDKVDGKWELSRAELELKKDPDRRLAIKRQNPPVESVKPSVEVKK